MDKYTQSEEKYKGYIIKVVMTRLGQTMQYRRTCEAWKDGRKVYVGKTKKEMKELIAEGYI